MNIENSFSIAAPRDDVVAHFLDAEQTLRCVPGVEGVTRTGEHAYTATLKAKVGPIRATFQGHVVYDPREVPERVRATGEGRDRASGSIAKVALDATFDAPEPGTTTVTTRAEVAIRGRFGQFGAGVIQAIADEMIGEFSRCVQAQLAGEEVAAGDGTSSTGGLASVAARGLVKGSVAKLGSLRRNEDG
ncbi:MAG: carbon monoxide dehydrogenase subunit G [Chloroflexota bacterium]|nr:carbon monoxide dehydrogenase subunit G [Chloroflexota bacterium]